MSSLFKIRIIKGFIQNDQRYRQIDPFGRDVIRKFTTNASEMKKLAARDYENLLQARNHHSSFSERRILMNNTKVRNTSF